MAIAGEEIPVELSGAEVVPRRKPAYSIDDFADGPLHPETMTGAWVAQPMIGLSGLVAMAAADRLAREHPQEEDGDGICGRANRVGSDVHDRVAVGRFGWKAGKAMSAEPAAAAMAWAEAIDRPLAEVTRLRLLAGRARANELGLVRDFHAADGDWRARPPHADDAHPRGDGPARRRRPRLGGSALRRLPHRLGRGERRRRSRQTALVAAAARPRALGNLPADAALGRGLRAPWSRAQPGTLGATYQSHAVSSGRRWRWIL